MPSVGVGDGSVADAGTVERSGASAASVGRPFPPGLPDGGRAREAVPTGAYGEALGTPADRRSGLSSARPVRHDCGVR